MAVEKMDVEATLEGLARSLALELRSVSLLTLAAGSSTGLAFVGLVDVYRGWARAELDDAGRLVEKIVSIGGEPDVEPPRAEWDADPFAMAERIAAAEEETIEALRETIPPVGDYGPGEALEHLLEHMIMRKQLQVDRLRRALRDA